MGTKTLLGFSAEVFWAGQVFQGPKIKIIFSLDNTNSIYINKIILRNIFNVWTKIQYTYKKNQHKAPSWHVSI